MPVASNAATRDRNIDKGDDCYFVCELMTPECQGGTIACEFGRAKHLKEAASGGKAASAPVLKPRALSMSCMTQPDVSIASTRMLQRTARVQPVICASSVPHAAPHRLRKNADPGQGHWRGVAGTAGSAHTAACATWQAPGTGCVRYAWRPSSRWAQPRACRSTPPLTAFESSLSYVCELASNISKYELVRSSCQCASHVCDAACRIISFGNVQCRWHLPTVAGVQLHGTLSRPCTVNAAAVLVALPPPSVLGGCVWLA